MHWKDILWLLHALSNTLEVNVAVNKTQ